MKAIMEGDTYSSVYGELPIVEPAVVYNEEADEVRIFALNCSEDEDTELDIELQGYGDKNIKKHLILTGNDLTPINTIDDPDKIVMQELDIPEGTKVVLPKLSCSVIILGN